MERADPNLSSGVISTVKVNCGYFTHLPLLIHNNAVHTSKESLRKLPRLVRLSTWLCVHAPDGQDARERVERP